MSDNPYTIGKVIELSTKILEMKLQINEYIKFNASLQEENEKLSAKLELIERNQGGEEEQANQNSKGSVVSRNSGKVNEHEFKSLREENKRLKADKVVLMKKITQSKYGEMQCGSPSRKTQTTTSNSWRGSTGFSTATSPTRRGRSSSFCWERTPRTTNPSPAETKKTDSLIIYSRSGWML